MLGADWASRRNTASCASDEIGIASERKLDHFGFETELGFLQYYKNLTL
jgi:hypothetical protein